MSTTPCLGRRPDGLVETTEFEGPDAIARALAEMAYLEAASIIAFVTLAADLESLGAPASLVTAARRSAADEVRHARSVGALAVRAGGRIPTPVTAPPARRSLEQIALENAVEGCVRETFGAAIAAVHAANSADLGIGRLLARIARDEPRHALLAWRVAEWLEPQLDSGARRRVRDARAAAVAELRASAAIEPDRRLREALGLPTARQATAVVEHLAATLWAA